MNITANVFIIGLIIGYAGIKDRVINLGKGRIIDTSRLKKDPFIIILMVCAFLLIIGERDFLNEFAFLLYGFAIGMSLAIGFEHLERRLNYIEKSIKAKKREEMNFIDNRRKSIRKSRLNK